MNKPLSHSLTYSELYSLCEELGQLKESYLQEVALEGNERYLLRLYGNKDLQRWVIFDLTPSQPFILSVSSTVIAKQKKPTPVSNFLKAHFKGLKLKKIEIAEKPNRTVKFTFENESELIFKCFPHGQALGLFIKDKKVIFPPQPEEKLREPISFIEPEKVSSWQKNESLALALNLKESKAKKESRSVHEVQLEKLEKSFNKMTSQKEKFITETQEKIKDLEAKLFNIKSNPDSIYSEIKKLKRRILEYGEKQNELKKRISFFKSHEPIAFSDPVKGPRFSGTKIFISKELEFWVGRSAQQNDELIKKASPHELWFHMRDYPSAHGILKGPKSLKPSEQQIEFCCQVIAQLSRSQKKPFKQGEKFDFIITPRKFVKKKKGLAPGQVVVERESVRRIAFKEVSFNVI